MSKVPFEKTQPSLKEYAGRVICGDCIEVMRKMPSNSIDTIITDPPYGLGFMGKEFDTFADSSIDAGFCHWLAGFVDGEGCFSVHKKHVNNCETYDCQFSITLRADDKPILEKIKQELGIGTIAMRKPKQTNAEEQARFCVSSKADCIILRDIFRAFPLRAKKAIDFEFWSKALDEWLKHQIGEWQGMKEARNRLMANRKFKPEGVRVNPYQLWCMRWAIEVLRIAKPGAMMLAFGGTRTYHRLTCAIEDAGWQIRDCMMWMYGCLSEDTEILTKKGWKPLHKTTKYDKILIYDITNNIYKWETPERWQVYSVNKDTAYRIKSDKTDQIVSKEHRCLVERNGKLVFKQAWELSTVERMPVLPQNFYSMEKRFWEVLFTKLCRKIKGLATTNSLTGQGRMDRQESEKLQKENVRGEQSSLEGRGNLFQKKRKLRQIQDKICSMSQSVFSYGSKRWLCYETSIISSTKVGQMLIKSRNNTSHRPQPREQRYRKSNAFSKQQIPQTIRSTITKIKYTGKMFCPTVSTGAFVARRSGKVFITGNSGFPKSCSISKQLDKARGAKPVIQTEEKMDLYGKYQQQLSETKARSKNSKTAIPTLGTEVEYQTWDITNPASGLAKLWDGYGTALKPAYEPIVVAMKPLDGTFAQNAEKYKVAGLNIDGARIDVQDKEQYEFNRRGYHERANPNSKHPYKGGWKPRVVEVRESKGRWPANVILDEESAALLDEQSGILYSKWGRSNTSRIRAKTQLNYCGQNVGDAGNSFIGDSGGASRFFKKIKNERACFLLNVGEGVYLCDECLLAGEAVSLPNRFKYCAKSSRAERNAFEPFYRLKKDTPKEIQQKIINILDDLEKIQLKAILCNKEKKD